MAELNTSSVLWNALSQSMARAHQQTTEQQKREGWTEEEIKVGDSLLHEFRQAGMALDSSVQHQYRQLSAREHELCKKLITFEVRLQRPRKLLLCVLIQTNPSATASAAKRHTLAAALEQDTEEGHILHRLQTHRDHVEASVLGVPRSLVDRYKFNRARTKALAQYSTPALTLPVNILADFPTQRWLMGQPHSSDARQVAYKSLHSLPVWCAAAIASAVMLLHHINFIDTGHAGPCARTHGGANRCASEEGTHSGRPELYALPASSWRFHTAANGHSGLS
jgi:hypothetical protein